MPASSKKGHQVTGLSRSKCFSKDVHSIIGDAMNARDLAKAVKGADVVISAIGHVKLNEVDTQTQATNQVILAVQKYNVKKIVSLTGSGVRIPGDKISLTDKALNLPLKIIDSNRINDGVNHYKALKNSNANWAILRVLKLTNGQEIDNYRLTTGGPAKTTVSRKTVAKILVDLAEKNTWDKKLPIVTKK